MSKSEKWLLTALVTVTIAASVLVGCQQMQIDRLEERIGEVERSQTIVINSCRRAAEMLRESAGR